MSNLKLKANIIPGGLVINVKRNEDDTYDFKLPYPLFEKINAIDKGQEIELSLKTIISGTSTFLNGIMKPRDKKEKP